MPLPISRINDSNNDKPESNQFLDISFLANEMVNNVKQAGRGFVTLSDGDATNIMNIWLHAEKVDKDTYNIGSNLGIDNSSLIRLKARGLLKGDTKRVSFTNRAKEVVKTMTLGESNAFLKDKKQKSYTEILASMDKRGKKGYRMAERPYDEYSHLICLADDREHAKISELLEEVQQAYGGQVRTSYNAHYPMYEKYDEALGACWINIAYEYHDRSLFIDKYYENEDLNDELNKSKTIPVDFDNWDSFKSQVVQIVGSFIRG